MLTLITSNSTEALADALARRQRAAGLHPLANTTLIVPSLGHSRWVRHALARRLGAAASLNAMFPAQFIWRLVAEHLAHVPGVERAAPVPGEQLRWWVYAWLSRVALEGAPAEAATQLGALCQNESERFKLAKRLAKLLGEYWVFRPEWLAAWQEGRRAPGEPQNVHTVWQRALWRYVAEQTGLVGKRHPFQLFAQQLRERSSKGAVVLPERVVIFGVTSLPPLYLQVFAELARYCPVELYSLSPSEAYWGDVLDKRALLRLQLPTRMNFSASEDVAFDETFVDEPDEGTALPSLLAAWGKNARDFHAALVSLTDEPQVEDEPCFNELDAENLSALNQLKQEWLALDDATEHTQWSVSEGDASIRVHGCTTLQRQLEVLHDELAHAFAQDATLKPGDIAVLMPSIEQAAPLIHGVFGAHADRPLPYSVTGVPERSAEALGAALQSLLIMGQGMGQGASSALARFEAPAVLQLLRVPALAARFAFTRSELDTITRWVQKLGIRNGYGDEPAALALSPVHSWQAGLARLQETINSLHPDADDQDVIAPWQSAPQAQNLLERLKLMLSQLAACRSALAPSRALALWQTALQALLEDFFIATQTSDETWLLQAREAVAALTTHLPAPMQSKPVSAAVISHLLSEALQASAPGAVPSGALTFAQLGELRGLPYRKIIVLGIEQGFAQSEPKLEFDLMAAKPRKGDRARARDELGALLDAALAAIQSLEFYTQSRDPQTGKALPLPLAVDDVLSLLKARTQHLSPAPQWLQEHALQRFSASSFYAPKPSYSAEYNAACGGNISAKNMDILGVYENIQTNFTSLSPKDAARFLANPARFQLKQRYNITLKDEDDEVQGEEPSVLAGLALWQLQQRLLSDLDAYSNTAPELPPGLVGELALADAQASVEPFMQATAKAIEVIVHQTPLIFRAEFRSLKLHDLAWLGLVQAQRALSENQAQSEAISLTKEQVLIMRPLPFETAQSLMKIWSTAWQADMLTAPWLPEDATWEWLKAQWKKTSKASASEADKAWRAERLTPLWQCLLTDANTIELDALEGWQERAQAWFVPLLEYCSLIKLGDWLEQTQRSEA